MPVTNTPTVHFYDGTFTSSAGGTFTGVSTAVTVDAPATVTFGATCSGMGPLANFGNTTIAAAYGSGVITNKANANLYLASGASSISSIITNDLDGDLYVNSAAKVTAGVNNNGNMYLAANLDMTGQTLNSTKIFTVSGQRTLTAAAFVNSGEQIYSINNDVSFDQLTCTGCAVTTGNLTLNLNFAPAPGQSYSWPLIQGTTVSTPPPITLPGTSSIFSTWTQGVVAITSPFVGQAFQVSLVKKSFADLATPGVNQTLASMLDNIATAGANPAQTALINALSSATTVEQFNDYLAKLQPNQNASAPRIKTSSAIFGKIEKRIASLRDDFSGTSGISAGDFNPNTALWTATFGSLAKQRDQGQNAGYKGRTAGILVGIDHRTCNQNIIGISGGIANTNVLENSSQDFTTKLISYHAVLYAANHFKDGIFFDWLLSSSMSKNNGHRFAQIGNLDFDVYSSTKAYEAGLKLNYGKNFDFGDYLRLSPLASFQYHFIHQEAYAESGNNSIALRVQPTRNKNIVTLGAGTKIGFPTHAWWLMGSKELRALITYDAINSAQVTTANFLSGGPSFVVSTTPARWALRLGADIGVQLVSSLMLQFSYDYELRDKYTDHTGMIKLKFLL